MNKFSIEKLSVEDELKIISQEDEERNMEHLKSILPFLFLSDKTTEDVCRAIDNVLDTDNQYLDDLFNLNKQRRAWFKVSPSRYDDGSYEAYRNFMKHKELTMKLHNTSISYRTGISIRKLINYHNFINNRVIEGKQQYKLMKLLKKHNILNASDIDYINSYPKNDEDRLICISRNPVDYLFCSTGQSFTSCMSLESEYGGLGLVPAILDPNRFMIFSSKPRTRRYILKDLEFRYFRYVSRSWGILMENNSVVVVRKYPASATGYGRLMHLFGISDVIDGENGLESLRYRRDSVENVESMFHFTLPTHENDNYSFPYLDYMGIEFDDNQKVFYRIGNYDSGFVSDVRSVHEFNSIRRKEDIHLPPPLKCISCYRAILLTENRHRVYLASYVRNVRDNRRLYKESENSYICKNCHITSKKKKEIKECGLCSISILEDENINYINVIDLYKMGNTPVCEECKNAHIFKCHGCGVNIYRYDIMTFSNYGDFNEYKYCKSCYRKAEEEYLKQLEKKGGERIAKREFDTSSIPNRILYEASPTAAIDIE